MKAIPVETPEADPFFSWHVNLLQLQKKHIIFVNDVTRLCVIIDGIRSSQLEKLQEKFKEELREYLRQVGVRNSLIEQYFLKAGEIVFSKTDDRSVLGTIRKCLCIVKMRNLTIQ